MMKFSQRIIISRNAEIIFDYTQDYNNRLKWDKFLIKAELLDNAEKADKGVKALCVAKNRLGMITEYVSFNRPKSVAIKMIKGSYLFKSFFGSWNFKEVGMNKTEVIFLYSFELNFPFTLIAKIIKNNFRHNVQNRLKDLKEHIEY